jgi:hypothetical protein
LSKRSEKEIMEAVMIEASRLGYVVWRNNSGMLYNKNGTPVKYGLCKGSSDLIGFCKGTGQFLAIEVKSSAGKLTESQIKFVDFVNKNGGKAIVCDDEKKLKNLLI